MSNSSIESRISALTSIAQRNKDTLDEASRLKAVKAAQGLLNALKSPVETVLQDVVMNSPLLMAIRMGVQFGAFKQIVKNHPRATTAQDIAEESGANVVLVDQIMRLLSASGYVVEGDVQAYKPSALTMVMTDSTMEATTRACFEIGNLCTAKAPDFFRINKNQFPTSERDTPFQLAMNTELSYFEWLRDNPDLAKDFQQWMTLKQRAAPDWTNWFDIQSLILDKFKSDSAENVLLIDVGGGEGHYLHAFREKFPNTPGRLVLQDLPHVISSIRNPPKDTDLMLHDFFTPQPVKGARAYFMHWILHDWPDEQCRVILRHTAEAMEPGYSRLIINEHILPDRDCDLPSACLSVMMMVQVAAFERSGKQWRALIESAGLKVVAFHQPPGNGEGVIEVMK